EPLTPLLFALVFCHSAAHRALHSFPTRRSSDLGTFLPRHRTSLGRRLPRITREEVVGHGRWVALHRGHVVPHARHVAAIDREAQDRKSTRLNSSHVKISYAVFCLKKKNKQTDST